jgi:DNA-directed RNA polymerase subunit D
LLPIKTDLKSYTLKEKCKCGGAGCAQCELRITLKAGKKGYVYAEEAASADPDCTFVYGKMPIVKLLSKQKVDLVMTAILGKGRNHMKWSPGLALYRREPSIKVSGAIEDAQKLVDACPRGLLSLKGKSVEVDKDKMYDCADCQKCIEMEKAITFEETGNLLFTIESWGQLTCKEILNQSADILINKIEEMESLI